MSWGYHRGGWHGPYSQGDSIAWERDSQVNEQNDFRWWWVPWKSQRMYQVVAEGYFQIKRSRKTSVARCHLNWDPDDKEEPICERAEGEMYGAARETALQPEHMWLVQEQKGGQWAWRTVRKGTKREMQRWECGHGWFCRPWKPCEGFHSKHVRSHWKVLNKWWCFIKNPLSAPWEKDHRGTDGGREMTEKASIIIPGASDIIELCSVSLYLWGCRFSTKKNTEIHLSSLMHSQGIIVYLEDNLWIASSEGWILTLFPSPLILCFECFRRKRSYIHFFAYPYYHKNERKKKHKKFVKSPYCYVAWFFW